MDYKDAQVSYLQKVAYKHHAGAGDVYGSTSVKGEMGCLQTSFFGAAITGHAQ